MAISKKYASSGWAAFERPFALWCEHQGIALDYLTQHDLHRDPSCLNAYPRALIVGHDEYWTWEMRDALEGWLDAGGQLARFAGNFYWQTRLSADLATQTCYKTRAGAEDPVADPRRRTDHWDHRDTHRPATLTLGLTGSAGVYAGWSRCAAHGAGGFTLYRPGTGPCAAPALAMATSWAATPASSPMRSTGSTTRCATACPIRRPRPRLRAT
jgi:hypothetical protein